MVTNQEDNTQRIIYIIRHGQALHNVANHCNDRDPKLTPLGEHQAKQVQLPIKPDLIVISPLTRAVQTAALAFPSLYYLFHLNDNLQEKEAGTLPCDTGREKEDLYMDFPYLDKMIFDSLQKNWYNPSNLVQQRVVVFKDWLKTRSEKVIAIVAHDGVFQEMCGKVLSNGEVQQVVL